MHALDFWRILYEPGEETVSRNYLHAFYNQHISGGGGEVGPNLLNRSFPDREEAHGADLEWANSSHLWVYFWPKVWLPLK